MNTNERGAAVVEMAVALLLLLLLVFGIIDMGRAIFTDIGLKEAAQSAAHHFAFTQTATDSSAALVGVASTPNPALSADDFEITCSDVERGGEDYGTVTVIATYELDLITPIVGSAMGGTLELHEKAEAERFFECPIS